MKRLILALLLLASPAHAGRGLVIDMSVNLTNNEREPFNHALRGIFRTLGMDFVMATQGEISSYELRNGYFDRFGVGTGATTDTAFRYVIVISYRAGNNIAGSANFDSLQLAAGWPKRPTLLISATTRGSANIWTDGAFDSTGFAAANGAGTNEYRQEAEFFGPFPRWAWHQADGHGGFAAGPVPPGTFEALLKQTPVTWYDYAKQDLAVADWDSLIIGSDSLTLVRRSWTTATPSGAAAGVPLLMCGAGFTSGGNFEGSIRRVVCALAALDSATTGQVLFQTRSGPAKFAAQIQVIGGTGRYNHTSADGTESHAGIFIPGNVDSGQTTVLAAVFDSLQARGVKASVGVQMNPDSTALYSAQLVALRDRWPLAHVFPFELGGLGAVGSNTYAGGNADSTHNYDGFGAQRVRTLLPSGCVIDTCHCNIDRFNSAVDTSLYCILKRQRLAVEAYFGKDRYDHVWGAPLEDWTPKHFSRTAGNMDSLLWVLHYVGIRGLRVGQMGLVNDVSSTATGAPRGWMRNQAIIPIRKPTTPGTGGFSGSVTTSNPNEVLGQMVFMPSRDSEASSQSMMVGASGLHDNCSEFLTGFFTGRWYNATPSPIYSGGHTFFTRSVIFEVTGSWLTGASGKTYKPGYWFLTDFKDWTDTVNRLAGRKIIEMGYADEAADWLVRSGLMP